MSLSCISIAFQPPYSAIILTDKNYGHLCNIKWKAHKITCMELSIVLEWLGIKTC